MMKKFVFYLVAGLLCACSSDPGPDSPPIRPMMLYLSVTDSAGGNLLASFQPVSTDSMPVNYTYDKEAIDVQVYFAEKDSVLRETEVVYLPKYKKLVIEWDIWDIFYTPSPRHERTYVVRMKSPRLFNDTLYHELTTSWDVEYYSWHLRKATFGGKPLLNEGTTKQPYLEVVL